VSLFVKSHRHYLFYQRVKISLEIFTFLECVGGSKGNVKSPLKFSYLMFPSCYLPEIRTKSQLNRVVQYLKRISLFFKHSWHVYSCILENNHRNSSSNIFAEKSTSSRKFKHFVLFRCTTEGIRKPHSKSHYYSILCNMPAFPQRS
jgi:hypothetical protein